MKNVEKPIAGPFVVLREEFDDWAVLFDPDTGRGFGLSPMGVYVWKLLDGQHSIDDMLETLRRDAEDVPQEAGEHLLAFVEELTQHALAGYAREQVHDGKGRLSPCPTSIGTTTFHYEAPKLINLSREQAMGGCCSTGTTASAPQNGCCFGDCVYSADCTNGICALGVWCDTGTSPGNICDAGVSAARYYCTDGSSAANSCVPGSGATCSNGGGA